MRTSRPPQGASPPAALPALLRASHLLGLALGSAFGKLRDSGTTAAKLFERAEEGALLLSLLLSLLLRMTRDRGPKGRARAIPARVRDGRGG